MNRFNNAKKPNKDKNMNIKQSNENRKNKLNDITKVLLIETGDFPTIALT